MQMLRNILFYHVVNIIVTLLLKNILKNLKRTSN